MVKESNCRLSVTLPKEMKEKLFMIAFKCGMTQSALIGMIVAEFVDAWEEKERESDN